MPENVCLTYYKKSKELISAKNQKYYQRNKDRLSTQGRERYWGLSKKKKNERSIESFSICSKPTTPGFPYSI